jgi:hypothetical protein
VRLPIGRRFLSPGKYRVVVEAIDFAENLSSAKKKAFRVVR